MSLSAAAPRRDARVIGLISSAHFLSHFYMLLLAPLFPLLREHYGVGYVELGFALSVFSFTTGLTQTPLGFVVDRYGARRLLIAAMFLGALAYGLVGMVPSYSGLLALMVVAGIANGVYHPADYSILNASVDGRRMGRAFSVHTAAGLLGGAMAPITVVTLLQIFDLRATLLVCGAIGAVLATVIWLCSGVLREAPQASGTQAGTGVTAARGVGAAGDASGLRLLFSVPVLMGVLFFVGITMTGQGISGFGVATLATMNGIGLSEAGVLVSAYLFAAPVGVLLGGPVADRTTRHATFAAGCFVAVGLALLGVATLPLSLPGIAALLVVAGLFSGAVSPSRDMMIRAITPPGQMGKVFGFVSSGFSIGGVVAPVMFGYLLDHHEPRTVFLAAGLLSFATTATVLATGRQRRRSEALAPSGRPPTRTPPASWRSGAPEPRGRSADGGGATGR